ncbi:AAA family ATPase [Myxococcus sp. SDU36]|uniref:AAA family ATPase n=1 Tax=Myxococcus sp. SDU36 TaxID=2831967 RepID=UPI00254390B0|nr:AAA family ATPase [Myxococcus sp. SDU36]WIG96536.1 AAA family ATPase [Myxococcus sp. SDU36]
MSQRIPEESLPTELSPFAAVEAAYPAELNRVCEALLRGLPVMVEADKELTPYFYKCLRDRLKQDGKQFLYLDGRTAQEPPPGMPAPGMMATLIAQLRDAVRGAVRERIVVLPHLDLLTTSTGGLTSEAREVIPLLYENPEMLWVGFKDPSFAVPRVIENLFPHKESILGVGRDRLRYLITQRECRKFGRGLQPYALYKHVSGVNAVRLRRLLGAITGEDYPANPKPAYAQLRSATLTGSLSVPELELHTDIGGYAKVKQRLQQEILDVLAHKDTLTDAEAVKRVEALLPRGMIFWGPPGTGKTLFAKAMASALGAAVQVVSGPELKSRWVGESEENLRQIFVRARQAAPSIIVFDELDSFASARGTYTGSGVEHSMVNQLLTEMDGFRKEELVFVVGTTNFVESLDPALLRPGRFEFQLCIPYPNSADRRAILSIYHQKLGLELTERALDYAVKRTGDRVEGTGTRFSGDHIQALCRALARRRLREGVQGPTEAVDVERALTEFLDRPELTPTEERVVATHEAGHAVCALFCKHAPAIDRISIRGDLAGSLGHVQYADPAHRYVVTRGQLLDSICMLFGGREAEDLLLDDLSLGSAHDLERATEIARELVEDLGMGGDGVPVRRFDAPGRQADRHALSDATRSTLEAAIQEVLAVQRARARDILQREKERVVALRDLLIERKVLDREAFTHLVPALVAPKKEPALG